MTTLAAVAETLTGPRVEDSWVEVVGGGELDGVESWSVEHNVNAPIRGGMSLRLRDAGGDDVDWHALRLRPWVRANNLTWALGVFLPASPRLIHDRSGIAWEVPLLDKMTLLDRDVLTSTLSLPGGSLVTDEVAALLASVGEGASAITPSDLTTRSPMTWEPGTTKLRVVNDLLRSIDYFSVWADRSGNFRAEPYRRPQDRSLAHTFAAGEAAIHSPEWSREQDIAGVPNRVVLIVEGDDTNPGMVSTADNTDPRSPYSIPSRGGVYDEGIGEWVGGVRARTYTDVEASDQATLDALAVRYLDNASTPSATLDVSHAAYPLDGNAVIRFTDDRVDTLAVVEGYTVPSRGLMTGTWREVLS